MPARRGCRRLGTEGAEGAGAKEVLGERAPPAPPLAGEGDESYVPDPDGWPNAWDFEVSEILHQTSQLAETDPRRAELRRSAIEICPSAHPAARRAVPVARRVGGRPEPSGRALVGEGGQRLRPPGGVDFGSYASPTIVGELKRHFRDHCWGVRVPRPF